MADKRLRTLRFPGLNDTYTIPQSETELEDFSSFTGSAIAIVSNNNAHIAIPADNYVYVYNHELLDTGLYLNISGASIAANAELSSLNVEEVTGGGLNTLKTSLNNVKNDIGIVEDTDTAQHSITIGQYVIWKGQLYTAKSAIPAGTTLSSTNLTSVSGGGLNDIGVPQDVPITISSSMTLSNDSVLTARQVGKTVVVSGNFLVESTTQTSGWKAIGTIGSGHRPSARMFTVALQDDQGGNQAFTIARIDTNGNIQMWALQLNIRAYLNVTYII